MKKIIFILFFLSTNTLASISANTLFLVSNEYGNGIFTVQNNSDDISYVSVEMKKINVVNNKLEETDLNKDNILLWDINAEPSKLLLNPGEIKNVGIKSLCKTNCDETKDRVYQIGFVPSDDPRLIKAEQAVNIKFGIAPYFIIPAKKQDVKYDFDVKENRIKIANKGNTFLKMEVSSCSKVKRNKCRAIYYILSGRSKDIVIPKHIISENMTVKVANHDQSIQKEYKI